MKNQNIKVGSEVPIELRKEIYKEALELISNQKTKYNKFEWVDNWLCWLLPSLLYGQDLYTNYYISSYFHYSESTEMFPELNDFLDLDIVYNDEQRINFLKSQL